ncbi:MAG TPA: DnaA N-terminal domain-containing protein, partial [Gaiellales bacterium]|nr:DnaA N-terminal domain-containing protein [Gaiellales bacterium]
MATENAAGASWERISEKLRDTLNSTTYGKWFGLVQPLEEDADTLVVGVPNEFTKTWIESHFGSLLNAAAAEQHLVVELRVAVSEAIAARAAAAPAEEVVSVQQVRDLARDARLNPRYTFDVFVIGPSNRFAHAAALAVAES